MAQTIAMVRGSGSAAPTYNSTVTLYTQSGGSATRVIFNGLAWYQSSNTNSAMSVYVNSAGGAPYIIGYFKNYVQSSQIMPSNNAFGAVGGGSGLGSDSVCFYQSSGASYPAYAGPSEIQNIPGQMSVAMQNFWIGSGDSVVLRISNQGNTTTTFGWSFTTITES